jgi:tetratricopeptide (TPR) repeat protein
VRRCGGLPLALRLAGARLAHRPRWRVADLVRRLGASALPELAAEDRSVASAFALSYGQLPELAKRVFRLLGLHPGPVFDLLEVAASSGLPLDEARDAVDDLIDVHLVEEHEADVFRLHDLLREYAVALAADLPADERRRAVGEVLDLQMHACAATTMGIPRQVLDRDLGGPEPRRPDLLAAVADPVARLERERPRLAAYIGAAADAALADYAWRIPRAAWCHLFTRGYEQDVRTLFARALAIVEENGDRAAAALVTNYLASAYVRNADFARSLELLDRSLRLHQDLGSLRGAATALGNRAGILKSMGRFAECVDSARQGERLRILSGDPNGSRATLHNLAAGYSGLGRHDEALHVRRRALQWAIESGDDSMISIMLLDIQREKLAIGRSDPEMIRRYLAAALRLAQRSGHRSSEGDALDLQGLLMLREGRPAEATALLEQALAIVRQTGDREYQAIYLNDLGAVRRAAGDLAGGLELHRQALAIAEQLGLRHIAEKARAAVAGGARGRCEEAE